MLSLSMDHSISVVWHRRYSLIGGANPPVIPVADEISTNDRPEFIRNHFIRIVTVIQQFGFHSRPHASAAGIIMAPASCTIHTLPYAILTDHISVSLTGVLSPCVTVNNGPTDTRKCLNGIFQRLYT